MMAVNEFEIETESAGSGSDLLLVTREHVEIGLSNRSGIDLNLTFPLETDERCGLVEVEVDLSMIEDLDQDVAARLLRGDTLS